MGFIVISSMFVFAIHFSHLYHLSSQLKAIPMLIFKGAPAPAGKPCGRKNTITHEIYHKLKDKWGNAFPDRDKCYITCTKTANSSGEKTLDFLHEVYFPAVGAEDGTLVESCGLLLDAF